MSRASISLCIITLTLAAVMMLFFTPLPQSEVLRTATIGSGSLHITCMLEGTVVHAGSRYLLSPVTGQVEEVLVKSGEHVAAGDLLFRLDSKAELQMLSVLNTRLNALAEVQSSASPWLPAVSDGLEWEAGKAEVMAALSAKQIRSEMDGVVEHVFVEKGDYVKAGSPIGGMYGDGLCIQADWTGNHTRLPKAGMTAFWCYADGTPGGSLVLEAVSLHGDENALRLRFRPTDEASFQIPPGSRLPVRLVLETMPESGLMPLDAIGEADRVWIVRNGVATAERIPLGDADGELIQVPQELAGSTVLLGPEQLPDRFPVRGSEDM